ncbi:MAG: Ig-like domain-containing protein, partial [Saprospiraceae bacterium]|nr:Ig-like domain-containing protein [Saprospiraceae bacterium]
GNSLTWQMYVGHFPHTFLLQADPAIGTATMDLNDNQLTVDFVPVMGAVGVAEFIIEYWADVFPPYPTTRAFRVYVDSSFVHAGKDYVSVEVNSLDNVIAPLTNDTAISNPLLPLEITHLPIVRNGTAEIAPDGQSILFTPTTDHEGMAYITYVACDPIGSCDKTEISICVLPTGPPALSDTIYLSTSNRAPVAVFLPAEGFEIEEAPDNGVLTVVSDDAWEYKPDQNFTGFDEFLLAKDSMYYRTVIVEVVYQEPANKFANHDRFYTRVDESVTFDVLANDVKQYPISSYTEPLYGTLTFDSAGVFTYEPDSAFEGAIAFAYTTCFLTNCETADVIVYVGDMVPENALTYNLITQMDVPLVINYEIPLDGYAFTINALPDEGDLSLYAGTSTINVLCASVTGYDLLVYEPALGFTGTDAFEIYYCIDGGDCHLVKVDVEVEDPGFASPCPCVDRCVWPGDVDASGQVDMADLLSLGWHIGTVGQERDYPDNTKWMGQNAEDWEVLQVSAGVDVKYADSDGNGVVEEADMQSIIDHYLKKHTLVPQITGLKADYAFELIPQSTELDSGDVAILDIAIGSSAIPVVDMHGMQFSLNLPPDLIDSSSLQVYFDHDSWLGHDAPAVDLQIQPWHGRIDAAYSRGNGVTASGHGVISTMTFIVVDDIEGIRPPGSRVPLQVGVNYAGSVNGAGHSLGMDGLGTTLYLNLGKEDLEDDIEDKLFVYPNPASGETLNVHLNGKRAIRSLELYDLTGRLLSAQDNINDKHYDLDISELHNGMYFVRVIGTDGVVGRKFEVIRTN